MPVALAPNYLYRGSLGDIFPLGDNVQPLFSYARGTGRAEIGERYAVHPNQLGPGGC